MIVNYIYSACIVIETNDLRICCDPWFTQGIYDGAWFQYPQVEDPIVKIGQIDFVYVSHIHPDHYDPKFLRELLAANPNCQLMIGDENQAFLRMKMLRDGFTPMSTRYLEVGATQLAIIPNCADPEINIDTALVVKDDSHIVVNLNDCPFDERQVGAIMEFCEKSPDLACLPYAGAGPYPQMYRFISEADRDREAVAKKEQFLRLFGRYLDALCPRYAMPFAGLYYLAGEHRKLNRVRGIPDAVEVRSRFGDQVVVLKEGVGQIDLSTGSILHPRTRPYDDAERDLDLVKFDHYPVPYYSELEPEENDLIDLLADAHRRAVSRIADFSNRWICLKTPKSRYLCIHHELPGVVKVRESVSDMPHREEIYLDGRHLRGLLERRYHWNNAEIGSHFGFYREPNNYDRRIYNLLNFLHV